MVPTLELPTIPAVTPPKKPRTEPTPLGQQLVPPEQQTTLNAAMTFPNPLTISIPYIFPNPAIPGVTAKRKVEEVRAEKPLEQSNVFKVPLPRIISTGANRMKPPPGIRTQPLPPDQRHFPPGPQKTIRVPTRILRRKESEYERGSLRVQPVRQTQTPTNLMKEVDEVQQIQQMISAEEMARAKVDQEMSTSCPQSPQIQSPQQVEQSEQDQNKVS